MVESVVETAANRFGVQAKGLVQGAPVMRLSDIEAQDVPRFGTGIEEFDRVLGGGLEPGGVVLNGGDPGIGKSTLLLQALANLSRVKSSLYVSGEESGAQIALRARRLGIDAGDLQLQAEIQLEKILATLTEQKPQVVVVDSIQTLFSDALTSAPGSVAQVRECAAQLTRFAKQSGVTIILVGHVTKEGALAGPRVLEHIVDTVLYFEGDTHSSFRLVRAFKNRFGAVNEQTISSLRKFVEEGGRIVAIGSSSWGIAGQFKLPISNYMIDPSTQKAYSNTQFYVPASVLRVKLESDPMTLGVSEYLDTIFDDSPVFSINQTDAENIKVLARFDSDKPLKSGWAWGQEKLKGGVAMASVKLGKGDVVLYGPEVNFRGQTHASFKLIFNAIIQD